MRCEVALKKYCNCLMGGEEKICRMHHYFLNGWSCNNFVVTPSLNGEAFSFEAGRFDDVDIWTGLDPSVGLQPRRREPSGGNHPRRLERSSRLRATQGPSSQRMRSRLQSRFYLYFT